MADSGEASDLERLAANEKKLNLLHQLPSPGRRLEPVSSNQFSVFRKRYGGQESTRPPSQHYGGQEAEKLGDGKMEGGDFYPLIALIDANFAGRDGGNGES